MKLPVNQAACPPRQTAARRSIARCIATARGALLGQGTATSPAAALVMPAADLLTRQVLRDGEVILLLAKPSRWYVALTCWRFIAGILIVLCVLHTSHTPEAHLRYCVDGGFVAISCRLMWAVLNWMGRLYVLTDQRIIRFAGVFHIDVVECPLRKVSRTMLSRPFSERLLGLGTIEIHPCDDSRAGTAWHMVNRPREVREQIEAAIRKTKEG